MREQESNETGCTQPQKRRYTLSSGGQKHGATTTLRTVAKKAPALTGCEKKPPAAGNASADTLKPDPVPKFVRALNPDEPPLMDNRTDKPSRLGFAIDLSATVAALSFTVLLLSELWPHL